VKGIELVFSLEGFRRLNTFKARSDKWPLNAPLSANSFPTLSERRPVGMPDIFQRDDGQCRIGLDEDGAGPFRTRCFAAAIARKGAPDDGTP
jgi:hypothetical protein